MLDSLLATAEVAARLGVSTRQVQNLVRDGVLDRVVRGYVDARSVDRLAVVGTARGRPWSEDTAWAAVALLSGVDAGWVGSTQLSRLRGRLRDMSARELVQRAGSRATVYRFSGHSSVSPRLRDELASGRASTVGLGLADTPSGVDAYVASAAIDGLVRRYALTEDSTGYIVLRGFTIGSDVVHDLLRSGGDTLAALDLSSSLDARARGVGRRHLDDLLEQLRG